jgi:hypothetical protein
MLKPDTIDLRGRTQSAKVDRLVDEIKRIMDERTSTRRASLPSDPAVGSVTTAVSPRDGTLRYNQAGGSQAPLRRPSLLESRPYGSEAHA